MERTIGRRHWVLAFVVVVLAGAAGLLSAGPASGFTASGAQTRVGASTPVMINIVGGSADIGAGQRLGKTSSQPVIVVATGVAAESGGARFVAGADGVSDTLGGAPNAVTLGRYPGYVRAAAMDGSRTFNLGDAWQGMAARGDRFGGVGPGSEVSIRNMRFLDKAIADGSEIRLSSDPLDPANAGSPFLDEIEYLTKQGYSLQGDRMVR